MGFVLFYIKGLLFGFHEKLQAMKKESCISDNESALSLPSVKDKQGPKSVRKKLIGIFVAGMSVVSFSATEAVALQCVPYARQESGLDIRGNAWTWWGNAAAKYERGNAPQVGSVLVFKKSSRMRYGHVAVVAKVVDDRNILVDHANWGSTRGGGRGKITRNAAVVDTSPNNDWSSVRVWYGSINDLGQKNYPTYGFIYPGAAGERGDVMQASFEEQASVDVAHALSADGLPQVEDDEADVWAADAPQQGNLLGSSRKAVDSSTLVASLDDDIASISPAAGGNVLLVSDSDEAGDEIAAPVRQGKSRKVLRVAQSSKGKKVVERPGTSVSRQALTEWKGKVIDVSAKKPVTAPRKATVTRAPQKDK